MLDIGKNCLIVDAVDSIAQMVDHPVNMSCIHVLNEIVDDLFKRLHLSCKLIILCAVCCGCHIQYFIDRIESYPELCHGIG